MAVPLAYNIRSAMQRWTSSLVAIIGIAGTVAVFIAMLALARGFKATLVSSGLPQNAIVQQSGADSEMTSVIAIDALRVVEDAPQVARRGTEPLVSAEVVVIANLPLRGGTGDANVQMRGVSERVLAVRDNVRVTAGRFLRPGLNEVVVGTNAGRAYAGLDLGASVRIGAGTWRVVGLFDAKGSAFDSEIWADTSVLNGAYQRPPGVFQSVTTRLRSADDFPAFKAMLERDPRARLQAVREADYYEAQSHTVTTLITVLGGLVAVVMGLGAVLGALNTMYSAVAERSREIAVLRALGFGGGSVVMAFVVESMWIALIGGVLGCLLALPVNGITTGTINWQTFSHLAFAFRITPDLLGLGLAFAVLMGLIGGVPPAIRAARANVSRTLRSL
ncbi:MAG TPA: FtsX-like permease family protein [Vicinamibacterales bacterium]|nr:FtsX-like permease family protein [Vicinamibacterales bacterium]